MARSKANPRIGSDFEDFLREEGLFEEVDAVAAKRVLAWQLAQSIEAQQVTKAELARRMKTSRAQVDRLLDPDYRPVSLLTLEKAAAALGKRLSVQLVDA